MVLVRIESTWVRVDSIRHWLGSTQIDIGPSRLRSTWTQLYSDRHWPGPTQLDMGLSRLDSTWAWSDLVPGSLDSTLAWAQCWLEALAHSARLGSGLTLHDFGLGHLGLTWVKTDSARLCATLTRANFAWPGSILTQLNLGPSQVKIQPKIHFG